MQFWVLSKSGEPELGLNNKLEVTGVVETAPEASRQAIPRRGQQEAGAATTTRHVVQLMAGKRSMGGLEKGVKAGRASSIHRDDVDGCLCCSGTVLWARGRCGVEVRRPVSSSG